MSDTQFFNLSEIPLAAVKRIEVDENGSSAVYGSDAIAGVVNIILKKHFKGIAANARYGWAKDIRNIHSSIAFGKQWKRGGFSVIGSYETEGGLLLSERLLTSSNDYTRYGGYGLVPAIEGTFPAPAGQTVNNVPERHPGPHLKCEPTPIQKLGK